ncbi:MAG: hypothetical protein R2697_16175 [Ilumatobacteraceae bacterium]
MGPRATWLLDRVGALTGADDEPVELVAPAEHDQPVDAALRATRTHRLGRSGTLYHELLRRSSANASPAARRCGSGIG